VKYVVATGGKLYEVEAVSIEDAMRRLILEQEPDVGDFLCVWEATKTEKDMWMNLTETVFQQLADLGKMIIREEKGRTHYQLIGRKPKEESLVPTPAETIPLPDTLLNLIGPQTSRQWTWMIFRMVPRIYDNFVRACDLLLGGERSISELEIETQISDVTLSKLLHKLDDLYQEKTGNHILCRCGRPKVGHRGSCIAHSRMKFEKKVVLPHMKRKAGGIQLVSWKGTPRVGTIRQIPSANSDTPRRRRRARGSADAREDHTPSFRKLKGIKDVCRECHCVGGHYQNCPSRFRK